jgi:hypothetical protein
VPERKTKQGSGPERSCFRRTLSVLLRIVRHELAIAGFALLGENGDSALGNVELPREHPVSRLTRSKATAHADR